jgi:membrane-bound serine protease (ClpP class)
MSKGRRISRRAPPDAFFGHARQPAGNQTPFLSVIMIDGGLMRRASLLVLFLAALLLSVQSAFAQSSKPAVVVLNANNEVDPAMQDYIRRGIESAESDGAQAVIIELDTPGGDIQSLTNIIEAIRASKVPVVVYVTPNGAMAGSAGALITMAGHIAAMAPEAAIGASSPVGPGGQDLSTTEKAKVSEIMKATIRPLVEPRGPAATQLALDMIDQAKAVSASEALQAHLIDFVSPNLNDLLKQLDGRTVQLANGPFTMHTANAAIQSIDISFMEQLLRLLVQANIAFILLSVGILALQLELTHPGAWVPGFVGVICIALAIYGMGFLSVNWFGLVFVGTAFVLFILDIKAPTHGALTAAGVASFIVGALLLFNTNPVNAPSVPAFEQVSVPLVVGTGIFIGLLFAAVLTFALRAQHAPIQTGVASLIGKMGTARSDIGLNGQAQVGSELWTAEAAPGSPTIGKGDKVEVVEVRGLRLRVRKI